MKIALLRHCPTEWNVLGRIQGHTDIPLSDAGLAKIRGLMPPPYETMIYVEEISIANGV